MSEFALKLPAWLPQPLREDPKKTGVLSALLLVLLILVARYLFGGASKAVASPSPTPNVINTTTAAHSNNQPAPQQFADGPVRAWVKQPVTDVPRNLFIIRTELYPRATPLADEVVVPSSTFWDAIGKSQAQQADESKQKLILLQNLQREAAGLELQSTMMGVVPQAIISGTMVREGTLVSSNATMVQFQVVKIEARDVIVERDGIQLRLRMKS